MPAYSSWKLCVYLSGKPWLVGSRRFSHSLSTGKAIWTGIQMRASSRCYIVQEKIFGSMFMFSTKSPIEQDNQSINSETKVTGPRTMPTRHSRHHFPPVAPLKDLQMLTDEILKAEPGTLFVYEPSKNLSLSKAQQYEEGLKITDSWRRKVEFILRGYSALFPNSIVDITAQNHVDTAVSEAHTDKEKTFAAEMIHRFKHSHIPDEREYPALYKQWLEKRNEISQSPQARLEVIYTMQKIIERLELESNVYVEMWAKHKSNRMELSAATTAKASLKIPAKDKATSNQSSESTSISTTSQTEEPSISDELLTEDTIAWGMKTLTQSYGAPPGPTIQMYDLILDAMAIGLQLGVETPSSSLLQAAKALQMRALERYTLDVNAKMDAFNIIPTVPTAVTFNSLIRASAVAHYDNRDILLRDVAIDAAFTTFDAMYRQVVSEATEKLGFQAPKRNSATYLYMLKTVEKYFPLSPTRGNIVHSLFVKAAVEEGVLDELIFEALLHSISPENVSHSENFDRWVKGVRARYGKDKYCYGFPSKWSMNKRSRRYNKKIALY